MAGKVGRVVEPAKLLGLAQDAGGSDQVAVIKLGRRTAAHQVGRWPCIDQDSTLEGI